MGLLILEWWPGMWTMETFVGRHNRWTIVYMYVDSTTHAVISLTSFDRYDSCNVGMFRNPYRNASGPAAALNTATSNAKYNYQLLAVLYRQHHLVNLLPPVIIPNY